MKKAGYEHVIFLRRLVEEAPESEESGESNQPRDTWWRNIPCGGNAGAVPPHGHVLGLFRENREARLAGVSQGESGQGRDW